MSDNNTVPASIIEAVRTYFGMCSLLTGGVLNVDFLPEEAATYSIDSVPVQPVVKQYMDGSSVRQFAFTLSTRTYYGEFVRQQLDNLAFFENIESWIAAQIRAGNLPTLPTGRTAKKLEVTSSGYVFAADTETAQYQIQLALTYYQEGER